MFILKKIQLLVKHKAKSNPTTKKKKTNSTTTKKKTKKNNNFGMLYNQPTNQPTN